MFEMIVKEMSTRYTRNNKPVFEDEGSVVSNHVRQGLTNRIANILRFTYFCMQMSSPLSAQPLKVTTSGSSSKGDQGGSRTPVASRGSSPRPPKPLANPADISSPHELTAFVRSTPSPPLLFFFFVHGMTEEHFRWKRY
jgi:hypothetical protein